MRFIKLNSKCTPKWNTATLSSNIRTFMHISLPLPLRKSIPGGGLKDQTSMRSKMHKYQAPTPRGICEHSVVGVFAIPEEFLVHRRSFVRCDYECQIHIEPFIIINTYWLRSLIN